MYQVNEVVFTTYGQGIIKAKQKDIFEWFYKIEFSDGKVITLGEKQLQRTKPCVRL